MSSLISQVENTLYQSTGLTPGHLDQVMAALAKPRLNYGDLYLQFSESESWSLEDGIVKDGAFNKEAGVGIRAIAGEKTGFAYTETMTLETLLTAAKQANTIVSQSGGKVHARSDKTFKPVYVATNPLKNTVDEKKVGLLHQIDRYARSQDERVSKVSASISGVYDEILVYGTDGTYAADIRPLVRLNVSVIVEEGGKREQGYAGAGGRYDYSQLLEESLWQVLVARAIDEAIVNLRAKPAPAGIMDIVLAAGWPGVLFHEAVGHGLEGDFNRKGASSFSDLMGKQVAASACTVVDDGTLSHRRGSLSIDDEGTPTECTTLIENGILKNYMQDKHNARLMKSKSTGNGRRESYNCLPMPRMTNTYLLPGQHTPEDIMASVKKGLYCANFGGGQVDITSGKFVFVANEAYLIENGKITTPVKGATLIGDGPTALHKITMVGNDLALDHGVGICGKDGQNVPVGVGQPTLRINDITVGGTQR